MNKSFDIIEIKSTIKFKLLMLLITIIFWGTFPLYEKRVEDTYFTPIAFLFFLFLIMYTLLLHTGIKKSGVIIFKSKHISLLENIINCNGIVKIDIIVNNFYFDRMSTPYLTSPLDPKPLRGVNNTISIKTNDFTISHLFQVKYMKEIDVLTTISKKYKSEGVNISYFYRNKRII